MPVHERGVAVPVGVRLTRRMLGPVQVPMVLIGQVWVLVLDGLVRMFVIVPLGKVEPDTRGHEAAGDQQAQRQWLAEGWDCQQRATTAKERFFTQIFFSTRTSFPGKRTAQIALDRGADHPHDCLARHRQ